MSSTIINRTQNGQVFRCSKCKAIHIEYKNLNFNFTDRQFSEFAEYINSLDGEKWEEINQNSQFKRKIIIPTGNQIFRVLLSNEELNELKKLFFIKEKPFEKYKLINFNFKTVLN